jgi:hypothetical protein
MKIRKPLAAVGIAATAVLSACSPLPDTNYHGTVGGNAAPVSTFSTPSVPAVPVTISGSGEQVKTADLVAAGYTITYQASGHCLIAAPVSADGSDGPSAVNGCGPSGEPASGTTSYHATGRTSFHVWNTDGSWSMTFNPLS